MRDHDTVLVPVGSTEQHGPHGPLLTDVLVPAEVARRVPAGRRRGRAIDQLRAVLSACRVHRRGPPADRDVHGLRRGSVAVAGDHGASAGSCSSTATTTTRYAIAYACANAAPRLPRTRARSRSTTGTASRPTRRRVFGLTAGPPRKPGRPRPCWHRPVIVDMDAANADAAVPRGRPARAAVHTAFFF